MARRAAKGQARVQAVAALALVAPLLVLVAAIGVRADLWPLEVGYDLLTLRIAWLLAFVGAAAAVIALLLALRDFARSGLIALVSLAFGLGTLGLFAWQMNRNADAPVENVSTDLVEVPGFGDLGQFRGGVGPGAAVGPETCTGAVSVPRQVDAAEAAAALEQAGFAVRGAGIGRAEGTREGFWFGFDLDAVIRIRPGQTDIRVAARDTRPHGGEACTAVSAISRALQTAT